MTILMKRRMRSLRGRRRSQTLLLWRFPTIFLTTPVLSTWWIAARSQTIWELDWWLPLPRPARFLLEETLISMSLLCPEPPFRGSKPRSEEDHWVCWGCHSWSPVSTLGWEKTEELSQDDLQGWGDPCCWSSAPHEKIYDLVTEESLEFFSIIKVDDNWLEQPVDSWEDSEDFITAKMFVHNVKTTNNLEERAIKMATEYAQ